MCVSWSKQNLGWKLTPEQEGQFVEARVTALDNDELILRVYGEHKHLKWGFELTEKGKRVIERLQALMN